MVGDVRDRTKIVALAVVTGPLAWYALAGGADGQTSEVVAGSAAGPASAAGPDSSPDPAGSPGPASGPDAPAAPGPAVGPAPTAAAGPPAAPPAVVERGDGVLTVVPGGTRPAGAGPLRRYTVAVEGGLGIDPGAFAAEVDTTLADPRSWGAGGRGAFQRVDAGPVEVRVVLASPDTTDRLCRPLRTNGIYSCGAGTTAVLNSMRWLRGADAYAGRLPEYRQYVVNHEVGHTLGRGHEGCPAPGRLAPVMMQQTKGVGSCLPSPWPYP